MSGGTATYLMQPVVWAGSQCATSPREVAYRTTLTPSAARAFAEEMMKRLLLLLLSVAWLAACEATTVATDRVAAAPASSGSGSGGGGGDGTLLDCTTNTNAVGCPGTRAVVRAAVQRRCNGTDCGAHPPIRPAPPAAVRTRRPPRRSGLHRQRRYGLTTNPAMRPHRQRRYGLHHQPRRSGLHRQRRYGLHHQPRRSRLHPQRKPGLHRPPRRSGLHRQRRPGLHRQPDPGGRRQRRDAGRRQRAATRRDGSRSRSPRARW